jgi:hypothetical protein
LPLKLKVLLCVYGVISPGLANMTLDGLAGKLAEKFPQARQA